MAEYIEREKLLSEVKAEKPLNWTDSEAEIQADGDYDYFIAMIESQPKADVAEIVRCKDCKNLSVHTDGSFYCRETGIEYKSYECEEYYCSYAVKTDEERGKDWKRKVSVG